MGITGAGYAHIVATIVALGAAVTALALTVKQRLDYEDLFSYYYGTVPWSWIDIVLVSTASVASALALCALAFQAVRGCSARPSGLVEPRSVAGIVLSVLGLVVHVGMLASLTAYFSIENVWENFEELTTNEKVLYIFGCGAGAVAWLFAVVFAILDRTAAAKHAVQSYPGSIMAAEQHKGGFITTAAQAYPHVSPKDSTYAV